MGAVETRPNSHNETISWEIPTDSGIISLVAWHYVALISTRALSG